MVQSYSLNITVPANTSIPFNSTSVQKGCSATHPSADTFELNKCGVYMVSVDASAAAATTIQLQKNGVAQPAAQSTGSSPSFTTLVQVDKNNTCCACSSPTTLKVINTTATTFTDANIVITKIC